MADVTEQVIPSLFEKLSRNNFFDSANTYEYIVSEKYCNAHRDDKKCFLPIFRDRITLSGDNKKFLQKLYAIRRGLSVHFFQVPNQWQNCSKD